VPVVVGRARLGRGLAVRRFFFPGGRDKMIAFVDGGVPSS